MTGMDWESVLGSTPIAVRPCPGGDICQAWSVTTADGRYFAKSPNAPDEQMLSGEAAGLAWLAEAVPGLTPRVFHVDGSVLVLEWIDSGSASRDAAESLGRRLAVLHTAAAGPFGWSPAAEARVGSLPMPSGEFASWPGMYAQLRLRPLLSADTPETARLAAVVAGEPEWVGPPEPASRIHGDLWSGNIVWGRSGAVLVDPAAHVGHRETDLAMLALFGCPHFDRLVAAYEELRPLAPGWRTRVALHQVWPLLVHARLFGGGYAARAERIAGHYLALG